MLDVNKLRSSLADNTVLWRFARLLSALKWFFGAVLRGFAWAIAIFSMICFTQMPPSPPTPRLPNTPNFTTTPTLTRIPPSNPVFSFTVNHPTVRSYASTLGAAAGYTPEPAPSAEMTMTFTGGNGYTSVTTSTLDSAALVNARPKLDWGWLFGDTAAGGVTPAPAGPAESGQVVMTITVTTKREGATEKTPTMTAAGATDEDNGDEVDQDVGAFEYSFVNAAGPKPGSPRSPATTCHNAVVAPPTVILLRSAHGLFRGSVITRSRPWLSDTQGPGRNQENSAWMPRFRASDVHYSYRRLRHALHPRPPPPPYIMTVPLAMRFKQLVHEVSDSSRILSGIGQKVSYIEGIIGDQGYIEQWSQACLAYKKFIFRSEIVAVRVSATLTSPFRTTTDHGAPYPADDEKTAILSAYTEEFGSFYNISFPDGIDGMRKSLETFGNDLQHAVDDILKQSTEAFEEDDESVDYDDYELTGADILFGLFFSVEMFIGGLFGWTGRQLRLFHSVEMVVENNPEDSQTHPRRAFTIRAKEARRLRDLMDEVAQDVRQVCSRFKQQEAIFYEVFDRPRTKLEEDTQDCITALGSGDSDDATKTTQACASPYWTELAALYSVYAHTDKLVY
ncbi:uncharacterized protein BXZ73DRAFT_98172 [Epithele typhae]|uniref:uncharacterized protein n=1 Tax=Epithele typhae TaxID=378194 RepID=UPI00200875D3|nr:uncharacterized protein BXZ73DRAFT_98172 [Epithele typhae]KAH9941781.1 hypothetical protein BXZ73DRAFT_98172 [Epithele typhae]